jgi:pilus assembly protein Flp/PilA
VSPILIGKEVKVDMYKHIARIIGGFRRDDRGQGLAEYALILALIAIVAIIALIFLGNQVSEQLRYVGDTL